MELRHSVVKHMGSIVTIEGTNELRHSTVKNVWAHTILCGAYFFFFARAHTHTTLPPHSNQGGLKFPHLLSPNSPILHSLAVVGAWIDKSNAPLGRQKRRGEH